MKIIPGMVVMVPTGQCGTVHKTTSEQVWVVLRSLEMWIGMIQMVRVPYDKEEQDNAPVEVPRFDPVYQKIGRDD